MKATALDLENRINTLCGRGKDNGRIINKLKRQLRALKNKEI